jgi:hypothetical protein
MISNHRLFVAIVAFVGLFPVAAHAGRPNVPCQSPFVFPDASVNVVVMPYRESGLPQKQGKGSGTELSLLIQMDVLSHILDHGNVGAVQLEATTPAEQEVCRPEIVGNKLLARAAGAEATVAPGNGLVLVWGLLYEEDEDLYVQTFAAFLRRDRSEDLTFSAGDDKFTARPSSQMIAFAPRRMTVSDLKRIDLSFQKANVLHTAPKDDAQGEPLSFPAKCSGCGQGMAGFLVKGRSGEWLQIVRKNPDGSSTTGWIHAGVGLSGDSLDVPMPELHFIEGAVGYLTARIDADANAAPADLSARTTEEQLTDFIKIADPDQEAMALAVAAQMTGIAGLLSRKDLQQGLAFAQPLFEKARTLVPYNADAIALATLSEVSRASLAPKGANGATVLQNPRVTAQRLAQASVLDPGNPRTLTNLHNFYNVVLRSEQQGESAYRLDRLEVQKQIKAIEVNQPEPGAPKNMGNAQWIDPAKQPYDPKQMKLDVQQFKKTLMIKDQAARPQ